MTNWVALGADEMRTAREHRGLSRESVSRTLHISAKTYERWEAKGEVPSYAVENVARALGLEVERMSPTPISVDDDRLAAVETELGEIRGMLA